MELWYSRAFHDSFYMFSEYLGCGRYERMRTLLDIDMSRFISDLHFASGNYRGGALWMLITPPCFGQWVAFGRRDACKLGLGRLADALGQLCGMGYYRAPRRHEHLGRPSPIRERPRVQGASCEIYNPYQGEPKPASPFPDYRPVHMAFHPTETVIEYN